MLGLCYCVGFSLVAVSGVCSPAAVRRLIATRLPLWRSSIVVGHGLSRSMAHGLLLAFGVLHPNSTVMLVFPPIAMKAKWFVVVYGLIELLFGLSGYQSGVAHFAHLGGMLWGFALLYWWKKKGNIRF